MASKLKTIGHYGIKFFESEHEMNDYDRQIEGEPYYSGEIQNMTYKKAIRIAEVHPNCMKYWEYAMMPLFKGYDKNTRGGTESPTKAIESLKTKGESGIDMPYIIIWKILN